MLLHLVISAWAKDASGEAFRACHLHHRRSQSAFGTMWSHAFGAASRQLHRRACRRSARALSSLARAARDRAPSSGGTRAGSSGLVWARRTNVSNNATTLRIQQVL